MVSFVTTNSMLSPMSVNSASSHKNVLIQFDYDDHLPVRYSIIMLSSTSLKTLRLLTISTQICPVLPSSISTEAGTMRSTPT